MTPKDLTRLVRTHRQYADELRLCQALAPTMLKDARSRLGLTQIQMADQLGIAQTYLCKIERGAVVAGVAVLVGLHDVLNRRQA